MKFLMIVQHADIANYVSKHGVDRLFVDLEYIGKDIRQKNKDTWKSKQTMDDVSIIRDAAPGAHLLVRVNPLFEGTKAEIDEAITRGADSIMLPMFRSTDELARFFDILAGRVEALPLFETYDSLLAMPEIVDKLPLTGAHIGLNDLHLDMRLDFIFQPIANGVLEAPCKALREKNIPFGIGGIARAREGIVSPDYLLGEHVRLGSSAVIISRTFHRQAQSLIELKKNMNFPSELAKLRDIYTDFKSQNIDALEQNHEDVCNRINDVVALIQKQKLRMGKS